MTVVPLGDAKIQVHLHLRNLIPNTLYAISDACHYDTAYTITTNDQGIGESSITLPRAGQTHWVFDGLKGGGSCCDFFGRNYWESRPIILRGREAATARANRHSTPAARARKKFIARAYERAYGAVAERFGARAPGRDIWRWGYGPSGRLATRPEIAASLVILKRMLMQAAGCPDPDHDGDCDVHRRAHPESPAHEVSGLETGITPAGDVTGTVHVTSNARFGDVRGGFTYRELGRTFHVKATCLQIARNRLLGYPRRTLPGIPLAKPYFDALITGLTDLHGPHEHMVLEVLDVDGKPRQLFGRQSWQYGGPPVIHPQSDGRCWLPYLLPVPTTPDHVEVR